MAFFTKSEARAAARRVTGQRSAHDLLNESLKSYKPNEAFDIFLSHSINDAELVLGIKLLLQQMGKTVYVDWIEDATLDRSEVTKETAEILRVRMRQSASLLYLATDNASSSKWMPWELGFFDGYKSNAVFILPVLDVPDQKFQGQEYLGLYPLITKEEIGGQSQQGGRPRSSPSKRVDIYSYPNLRGITKWM